MRRWRRLFPLMRYLRPSACASLLMVFATITSARAGNPTLAFHYGAHPPYTSLMAFDRVVLEPAHVLAPDLKALVDARVEPYAYLSVGEAHTSRPWFVQIKDEWKLDRRTAWGGVVLDPLSEGWRAMLTAQAEELWQRGFRGLFLDTLDSYEGVLALASERTKRAQAVNTWMQDLHKRLPLCKLILNRGFGLFPEAAKHATAMVAESLFAGYDPARDRYVDVSEADRTWLISACQKIQDRHGIPVTIIDYVAPENRVRSRDVAKKITALGFSPWVADGKLERLGMGEIEVVPRRILLVYDSQEAKLVDAPVHRLLALPVEHLGFAVDYLDATGPLPQGHLGDEYAGIVTWLADGGLPAPHVYRAWLMRQIAEGVKVAMLGRFGFHPDPAFLSILGIELTGGQPQVPVKIVRRDALMDFETPAVPVARDLEMTRTRRSDATVHLELTDGRGAVIHPVVTAPWGGMALYPYVLETGEGHLYRWYLDPFAFITRALALQAMPALDLTTENGRRLLTSHIDGDGFLNGVERPGGQLACEVILKEILRPYPIPTTVSVIEGEVGAAGLYPAQSKKLEAIARQMFRLDHVEPATHTFSHPFDWPLAESGQKSEDQRESHLPIPGYKFDRQREIAGSAAYIDSHLLPPGKKTKMVLWSGNALPGEETLALVRRLNLFNVNGTSEGDVGRPNPTVAEVSAFMRPVGRELQVYAAITNENSYTNLWRGPFYGYRRVIETFMRTETPRRLKPIGIYYHFYSAAKPAGLTALKQIHEWVMTQDTLPGHLIDYAQRVQDFFRATAARTLDGGWRYRGLKGLRTVRFDSRLGWPDLAASPDVLQVDERARGGARYASFRSGDDLTIHFKPAAPTEPHLAWANARVVESTREPGRITARFSPLVPLRAAFSGCAGARAQIEGKNATVSNRDGVAILTTRGKEAGRVVITCH